MIIPLANEIPSQQIPSRMELERMMEIPGVRWLRLRGDLGEAQDRREAGGLEEVWVWLNRTGEGVVWGSEDRMFLRQWMYGIFGGVAEVGWRWTRLAGTQDVEVMVISRAWLARRIGGDGARLHPEFARWLEEGGRLAFAGLMTGPEGELASGLRELDPASPAAALRLEARVLEWSALRLFRTSRADEGAGFCQRVHTAGVVGKAIQLLATRLEAAIDLNDLGKRCGVSPAYLSRRVKQETGRTLREHQRKLRIGLACELLRVPDASVTGVALDVGYQSLSHFAKAFREETGRTPSEWRLQSS